MTDRELLERAARAAGYRVIWYEDLQAHTVYNFEGVFIDEWAPLTDDGDALRLACDLGLSVYPVARTSSGAACSAVGSATCGRVAEVADPSLDVRAATRRAIVRAAAEMCP